MGVIKCKMCGGDLIFEPGSSVAECEFCGCKQTIPNQDDDKKLTQFARANRLRMSSEFDKAAGIYESIVADFPEEAEAYWGLVLCKYGIEYVDDPDTGSKIPTCHRSSFDSVMDDKDFEQAYENADSAARKVYREEAKQIEDIRKGIIEVSGKEDPYDIFICYKETAEDGNRTLDSTIAQDVYDALTQKGYRVFFSRITLEDKLGKEYEPYIFAALNSAKIMLAFGTSYEYFNAVWVKNEWSRYLKMMAKDKDKHLIPCYKNVDPYDMPREFAKLQAQDMGKVGAMQDLLRGIEKILPKQDHTTVFVGNVNVSALMTRAKMELTDCNWKKAEELYEKILDNDPKCGEAHLGLFLAENELTKIEDFWFVIIKLKESRAWRITPGERANQLLEKYGHSPAVSYDEVERMLKFSQATFVIGEKMAEKKEEFFSDLELNPRLRRARMFGQGEQVDALLQYAHEHYDQISAECQETDEKNKAELQEAYEAFLDQQEQKLQQIVQKYDDDIAAKEAEQDRIRQEKEAERKRLEQERQDRIRKDKEAHEAREAKKAAELVAQKTAARQKRNRGRIGAVLMQAVMVVATLLVMQLNFKVVKSGNAAIFLFYWVEKPLIFLAALRIGGWLLKKTKAAYRGGLCCYALGTYLVEAVMSIRLSMYLLEYTFAELLEYGGQIAVFLAIELAIAILFMFANHDVVKGKDSLTDMHFGSNGRKNYFDK